MIETIVGGLILAAVSGLSFIAYKHPCGYQKIGTVIEMGISIIFAVYMIWVFGYQQGFYDGNRIEEKFASPEYPIDPFPWLFIAVLIIQAYLSFLRRLPSILEMNKETEEKDKVENRSED